MTTLDSWTGKESKKVEEWEIEFNKRFPQFIGIGAEFPIFDQHPNREHIKAFISSLLISEREKGRQEGYNQGYAECTKDTYDR